MTDTTTTSAGPGSAPGPPGVPPGTGSADPAIAVPAPDPSRSRAWVGLLAAFVAVALLSGATAALFVRVEQARDRADEAVVLAQGSDTLQARIAEIDARLASLQAAGAATADDLASAREQVSALRKCVNNAIDAWAQATQSGKPAVISKC